MDQNGPDWCEAHLPEIADWLAEEARARRLPFLRPAATLLIHHAIKNARRRPQLF